MVDPVTSPRQPTPGSPRAALTHRAFRWVYLGTFASNIGTWMQNIALISFADHLTHDAAFVGLITFAQLGPMLLLSPFGGVLADRYNRRAILIIAASVQLTMSVGLAIVANHAHPNQTAIVLCVLGIGIAAAANAPAAQAILPALVGKADLRGAIALNSAQMNASRVVGPLLAVLPFLSSPSTVFLVNAATYLFVILAVAVVRFDGRPAARTDTNSAWRHVLEGLAAARANRTVARALTTVAIFSFFSLVFIYQMKGFAREDLHLDKGFGLLFACFGVGAAIGAIAVGTRLAGVDPTRLVRGGLAGFAVSLGTFALLNSPPLAYPAAAGCGFFYFVVITALSTAIQIAVEDEVRGRVMGLWMMAWAGLVPIGSLVAGYVIRVTGFPAVFLGGAIVAGLLIVVADLRSSKHEPVDPVGQPDFL